MVDCYPVLFLRRYGAYYKGTVAGFHPKRAAMLISEGIAKPYGQNYADRAIICKEIGVAASLAGLKPEPLPIPMKPKGSKPQKRGAPRRVEK